MKSLVSLFSLCALLFLSSPTLAKPWLPSNFSEAPYKSLDLNRYCKMYGSSAYASLDGSHAYQWSCRVGTLKYPMSIQQACEQQWGSSAQAVLLGSHGYDWACARWSEADGYVAPVIVIAYDDYSDIGAVNRAIERVAQLLTDTQQWYRNAMASGRTFRLLRPTIMLSLKNSQFWHDSSCITWLGADIAQCAHLAGQTSKDFDYFDQLLAEVTPLHRKVGSTTRMVVPMFVSSRNGEPFWIGGAAANIGNIGYNTQPPVQSTGVCSNDINCGIYTLGHEMGHNFGLPHTCDRSPQPQDCHSSIMQRPSPFLPNGRLLSVEQTELDQSPFFQ